MRDHKTRATLRGGNQEKTLASKRTQLKQKKPIPIPACSSTNVFKKKQTVESIIFKKNSGTATMVDLESRHEELTCIEDSFEVIDKLTEGGQGEILRAKDRCLNRLVALKSLKQSPTEPSTNKRTFLEEAKLTAQLDHPSIIPVYSVNTDQCQGLCFSMKLVSGITLANYLDKVVQTYEQRGMKGFDESISLANRLEYFLKVCDAITYAHDKYVVHRDLKPENIMIGQFREVYVMDWGISGIIPRKNKTQLCQSSIDLDADTLFGTPGFIDPASVDDPTPNAQADIYALGIILYQVVTLRKGFIGSTSEEVLLNAINGKQPAIEHRFSRFRIAPDLSAIIETARAPLRSNRYPAVDGLAADIRRYLSNNEVSCYPDNLPRKAIRRIQKNLQLAISLALMVILLLAALTIYSLLRNNQAIKQAKIRELALTKYQAKVARQAHNLESHFLYLAHLLVRMSDKINQCINTLNSDNSNFQRTTLYSAAQYDQPRSSPTDSIYAPAYRKKISLTHPVYKLAPGVTLDHVKPEIEALFSLSQDFLLTQLASSSQFRPEAIPKLKEQAIHDGLPIMWVYAGFEKGYLISFPGKGGYPKAYDPRDRPWYRENQEQSSILWGTPYYDINGLGIVLPCSYPLYDKNNDVYGVAAIDVTLDYLISELMPTQAGVDVNVKENTILDPEGNVLVSTRQQPINRKKAVFYNQSLELRPYPNTFIRAQILQRKEGQIFEVTETHKFIYAFASIPSLNWYYLEKVELRNLLEHAK